MVRTLTLALRPSSLDKLGMRGLGMRKLSVRMSVFKELTSS